MARIMLGFDNYITFVEGPHKYFNQNGIEFKSVTRVCKSLEMPFDRQGASLGMALSESKKTGETVEAAQLRILQSWDDKRDSASEHGTEIHGHLEDYWKTGRIEPKLANAITTIRSKIEGCYRWYPEIILYSDEHKVAGTSDLVIQRQKSNNSLYDFYDYKTNKEKGIEFDSIKRKNGEIKHNNRFLLPPLDHLEQCNFIIYTIQLSIYALCAELTYGIRVGRLCIIFIDENFNAHFIPTVYLKQEAMYVLNYQKNLLTLPEKNVISAVKPIVETTPMQNTVVSENNDEDW